MGLHVRCFMGALILLTSCATSSVGLVSLNETFLTFFKPVTAVAECFTPTVSMLTFGLALSLLSMTTSVDLCTVFSGI